MKKRILSLVLSLSLVFCSGMSVFAADGAQSEEAVQSSEASQSEETAQSEAEQSADTTGCSPWAEEEIAEAIGLGFVPEELRSDYTKPVTRQEFAKIALYFAAMQYNCDVEDYAGLYCRYYKNADLNLTAPEAFDDCQDYYVTQARAAELVNGVGDNLFQPDRSITREESAVLLENAYLSYAGQERGDDREEAASPAGIFEDGGQISDWAADSVSRLYSWGVMNGTGENRFDPEGSYTREQCIASFMRLYRSDSLISRGNGGRALCPYSLEELTEQVRSIDFYHEEKVLENDFCTVLWGYQSTNRGNQPVIAVIYKEGGIYDLDRDLTQRCGTVHVQGMEFGEEDHILTVTGTDPAGEENMTFTVDLNTRTIA